MIRGRAAEPVAGGYLAPLVEGFAAIVFGFSFFGLRASLLFFI